MHAPKLIATIAAMSKSKPLIGFVGQGYVGGTYANNFQKRGYKIVRYSLEEKYRGNKEKIKDCDLIFVCVPTPTTPKGFDFSIVEAGISLGRKGAIAVVKSTLLPGTTSKLQKKFPGIRVLCSPEFLSVATAQKDADNPFSNIVGIPRDTKEYKKAAALVHSVLPNAGFSLTCMSVEAELIKYAHNISGYMQVLTFNLIYDLAKKIGADWAPIEKAVRADPLIPNRYASPLHKSGRGAGGACFIKDMAAFARLYRQVVGRNEGVALLAAAQKNNIALLTKTKKDLKLLSDVYGAAVVHKRSVKKRAR